MGYYVNFNISIHDGEYNTYDIAKFMLDKCNEDGSFCDFQGELEELLKSVNEQNSDKYILSIENDGVARWIDHENEMRIMSKAFPTIVFKLHVDGEDGSDIWDKYFLDGKMQYCQIVRHKGKRIIPPFSMDELE